MNLQLSEKLLSYKDYFLDNFYLVIIGLAVWALLFALRGKISRFVGKFLYKTASPWPVMAAGLQTSVKNPLRAYLPWLGFCLFLTVINPVGALPAVTAFTAKLIRIVHIVVIAWITMNLTPFITSMLIKNSETTSNQTSAVAIKFTANVLKLIIVSLAVVVGISELGYNINGIITGLGIGGLTLSLAAQKTASNLFSGFEIVADKPFDVGDYIKTPSCEGTVEDMTMRSTRIRTMGDMLIVVPNSTLMNESIINYSKMGKRMVNDTIGLTYSTPNSVIKKSISDIQSMLYAHPQIDNERILVTFHSFEDSCLQIECLYFTTTTDRDEYMRVKEDINYKIRDILEENGAGFAFPSTSVYMETV